MSDVADGVAREVTDGPMLRPSVTSRMVQFFSLVRSSADGNGCAIYIDGRLMTTDDDGRRAVRTSLCQELILEYPAAAKDTYTEEPYVLEVRPWYSLL